MVADGSLRSTLTCAVLRRACYPASIDGPRAPFPVERHGLSLFIRKLGGGAVILMTARHVSIAKRLPDGHRVAAVGGVRGVWVGFGRKRTDAAG